jgi:hypothetical protein
MGGRAAAGGTSRAAAAGSGSKAAAQSQSAHELNKLALQQMAASSNSVIQCVCGDHRDFGVMIQCEVRRRRPRPLRERKRGSGESPPPGEGMCELGGALPWCAMVCGAATHRDRAGACAAAEKLLRTRRRRERRVCVCGGQNPSSSGAGPGSRRACAPHARVNTCQSVASRHAKRRRGGRALGEGVSTVNLRVPPPSPPADWSSPRAGSACPFHAVLRASWS